MLGFGFRVIGLVLGKFLGSSGLVFQRVSPPPHRVRRGRFVGLFLITGSMIAGLSNQAMGIDTDLPQSNVTVDPITQPSAILNNEVWISPEIQDPLNDLDAEVTLENLAQLIPLELLDGDSLLTDTPPGAELTPPTAGADDDLFNDLYVDLFDLGDLYLGNRETQLQLDSPPSALFADSFLTSIIPEPASAAILASGILGLLAHTPIGRNR